MAQSPSKETRVSGPFCGLLLLLLLVLTGYYFPWLTNQNTFYIMDLQAWYHPLLTFMSNAVHNGHLALWNPYVLCGVPQVAYSATNYFYPLNWLFCLTNFNTALAFTLVFQQLVAGVGMFLLVASIGWGWEAAILAAITYALSGYMFGLQTNMNLQGTAAWLPISIYAFLKINHTDPTKRVFRSALSAMAFFMLITAGMPEIFLPTLVFCGFYTLWQVFKSGPVIRNLPNSLPQSSAQPPGSAGFQAALTSPFALRLISLLIPCLLAMPALVPAYEWSRLSNRASGLSLDELFTHSATWYDILCLFLAQPFGDMQSSDNQFFSLFLSDANKISYIPSVFVGPAIITMSIWGTLSSGWRQKPLIIALLLVSILFALGSNSPVAPFVVQQLHISLFRFPLKLMIFPILSLSLLAAFGFSKALQSKTDLKQSNLIALAIWFGLAIFGAWLLNTQQSNIPSFFGSQDLIPGTRLAASHLLGQSCLISAAEGTMVCILLLILKKWLTARLFVAALISLQVILLLSPALSFNRHPGPPDYYSQEFFLRQSIEKIEGAKKAGIRVAMTRDIFPPPESLFQLEGADRTINIHNYQRQLLVPLTNVDARVGQTIAYVMGQTLENFKITTEVLRHHFYKGYDGQLARYCQMTSTQYIYGPISGVLAGAAEPELDPYFFSKVLEDKGLNLRLYKVQNILPRAYFARQVKWAKPHATVVDFVANSRFDQLNPHDLTLLEHNTAGEVGEQITSNDSALATAKIALHEDRPEEIRIETEATTNNYLVLADQFYPGWQATLDGKETKIFQANALLRAVFVPSGKHIIEFMYKPASLAIGYYLASIGVLGLLFMMAYIAITKLKANKSLTIGNQIEGHSPGK